MGTGVFQMWSGGVVGVVCGLLLTADAAPGEANLLGGLLGGVIGALAPLRRPVARSRGVRWPVLAGVLTGGAVGGLIGVAVVAPACAVDGGTLTALCILAAGLGGGRIAAGVRSRPIPSSPPTGT